MPKKRPADGWDFGRDPDALASHKAYKKGLKGFTDATKDFESIPKTQKKYWSRKTKGLPSGSINPSKRRKKR